MEYAWLFPPDHDRALRAHDVRRPAQRLPIDRRRLRWWQHECKRRALAISAHLYGAKKCSAVEWDLATGAAM